MAFVIDDVLIFHCPKTGGKFIESVLPAAGVDSRMVYLHESREILAEYGYGEDYHRAAFVRHPYDWYWSYWCFQSGRNWKEIPEAPWSCCRDEEFGRFVECMVDRFPGCVSRLYEKYVGPPQDPISMIGRTEDLRGGLSRLLEMHDIPHDKAIIDSHCRVNVSRGPHQPPDNGAWRRLVEKSEQVAMERFGY